MLINQETGCSSYNHEITHVSYLASPAYYRKFLNGVADYIEFTISDQLKNKKIIKDKDIK
jgi:hypothetical protein